LESNGRSNWQSAQTGARAYFEFEKLVDDLFRQLGYATEQGGRREYGMEIDILATLGNVTRPVEVKLHRASKFVSLSKLRVWAARTAELKQYAKGGKPLLVVGCGVQEPHREWAEGEFQIEIWDRNKLLELAGDLRPAFESAMALVESAAPHAAEPTVPASTEPIVDFVPEPSPKQGELLIEALAKIKPGRTDASKYERLCREIIKYLFGGDLIDPRTQSRTEDRLNIFDIIYRVAPKHPFWITLTRDFRARVVLFECKNYTKAIGPMQVFTTERYLSAMALRPVCFVLSRLDPKPGAMEAASGAMRESSKLLIFLSDANLIEMLKVKDAQLADQTDPVANPENDPTEILDQKIYDFIAGLPR
jgi:hypothetical protein